MKAYLKIFICSALSLFFLCSCSSSTPPSRPLTYLALEKPKGVINTKEQKELKLEFSKGGFYFWNYNFRPAADIEQYLSQAHKEINTNILKNVDIQLNIPFAFDVLLFGYNRGTDTLTCSK